MGRARTSGGGLAAVVLAALTLVALVAAGVPAGATSTPAGTAGVPSTGDYGGPRACQEPAAGITEVSVGNDTVTITGAVSERCPQSVEIHEVAPSADGATVTEAPASTPLEVVRPDRDGTFRATVDRTAAGADRLYSGFVAVGVRGDTRTLLGSTRFADDWTLDAPNSAPRPEPTTQKGVAVTMTSDAEAVGAGHAAVTVGVNYLMTAGPGEPGQSIEFEYGGETYYFDRSYVDWLDHMIKPLSDNDMLVYLVLVLVYDQEPNSSFPILVHPEAPTGAPTSFMTYAFNTVTPEGIAHYTAVMEFLASRYTRDDERYGRAMDYIVGNEIDSAGIWQQMGGKTLPEFLRHYEPALRIGFNAARKYHADARVYTSLDHFWTTNANPNDPLKFYDGRDVLDGLAALTKDRGDFPWQLAYHPYPANMLDPRVWDDPVTDDPDTPKITFKNIATLPEYLDRPELHYDGEPRRVILSEQGCQSPTNSAADQELQAACFAYAYYKILAADGIDAFIWDPQVDNRQAGGLRIGLWTWDESRTDFPASPGEKKQIYDLFANIDTPGSLELTEFAKDVIGIDEWTEVIPGFDPSMIDQRRPTQQVGASGYASVAGATTVSGFEDGVDGWQASDHVGRIESVPDEQAAEGDHVLRAHFDDADVVQSNGTNSKTWRGVDLPLAEPLDASVTPHLALQVRVPEPEPGAFSPVNRFSVQVRAYGADGTVATGVAAVEADSTWQPVQLDLSSWSGRDEITRIKVWAKGSSGDDWLGTFDVDGVVLAEDADLTGVRPNLDLRARAAVRGAPGSQFSVDVVNNGTAPLTGDLEVGTCDAITITEPSLPVAGLAPAGGATTVTATLETFAPVDPDFPLLCLILGEHRYAVTIEMPAPPPTLIYDFEDGTQGWTAGENVVSVATASSFPNGPQRPHGGTYALDAIMADGDVSQAKTVSVRPETPLDLGTAEEVYAWVDAYGGVPGATGYEATLTLHSGDESISQAMPDFVPDSWNRVAVDVSDWPHRDAVTGIDVSYRVLGTDFDWVGGPHLQVDDVGVTESAGSLPAWRAAWGASIGGHYGGDSRPDATYRQALDLSTGGSAVRVRFVNPFSDQDLVFDAASVGVRAGTGADVEGEPRPLTVMGSAEIRVRPGETVYTDPVALPVSAGDDLLVSTHAAASLPLLSHDWALKTQYATVEGAGDHTGDAGGAAFAPVSTSTYWLDAVDVLGAQVRGTVVALGDSITDGAGADLDADNRWPDVLADRLDALAPDDPRRRAVVNAGIGGNTLNSVENPLVGVNGLARLDRDVLTQTGVTDVVVFHGTNDIYVGETAAHVIASLETAAQRIHDAGARAVVATLIPRGNGVGWTAEHEERRLEVNEWIRSNTVYDAVIDFDAVVDDPADPGHIRADYDADGTHPNAAGYAAMAGAIDLDLFAATSTQQTGALR
ncbi:DUF5722 domain-containing protein [Jiangella asiatica]|uniref:DUF5722 domain-containing protein n=1 Tax=Jiangella asiatica TaxID=2530372 RepID=A0A4R5D8B6_9ACTN|nr:DUF5722 domain-containing protein [Jiangella asiatica]TDE08140.1 hypothetical protein E1269_18715 [Jiangella asiatica]